MRKTKIICTIGPVTDSYPMLEKLANAGMDIVRLNMSHGDHESAAKVIKSCAGDYQLQQLQQYQTELENRFGERQPEPGLMERLPMGIKRLAASQLMKTHWFTRNIVTDRWFLQSQQEPLTQN